MPSSHYDCSYVSWTLWCMCNLMISMLTGVVGLIYKARCYFGFSEAEFQGNVDQYIMLKLKAPDVPNYEAPVNSMCCSNCLETAFTVFI